MSGMLANILIVTLTGFNKGYAGIHQIIRLLFAQKNQPNKKKDRRNSNAVMIPSLFSSTSLTSTASEQSLSNSSEEEASKSLVFLSRPHLFFLSVGFGRWTLGNAILRCFGMQRGGLVVLHLLQDHDTHAAHSLGPHRCFGKNATPPTRPRPHR